MTRPRVVLLFLVASALAAPVLAAPQAGIPADPPASLTLDEAIQYAADHYPSIRSALERANASIATADAARAAYLPRLDAVWQSSRATANNIVGQVLPQSVIPGLTGPVLPATSGSSAWGSAPGALLSWDAFDFGQRHASVVNAEAGVAESRAAQALTRLDVQQAVARAFLAVLAAQRAGVAGRADLDRRDVLLRSVRALVDNQLRPGVDLSRAEAERAAAATRVIQDQQAVSLAEASLGRALGGAAGAVTIAGERLLATLPPSDIPPSDIPGAPPSGHPLAQVRQAALEQARSAEAVVAHADRPHIVLQSAVFARGSGVGPTGMFDVGWTGLRPDRANWAAGVQFVVPNLLDFRALSARKAAAAALERASAASYEESVLAIATEQQAAAALLQGAREVAANTPVQLAAARETETRARARYQAGLASITEVADAQSLLAQAEVQDELARVDVWRALLAVASARGDLAPFVDLVRRP